MCGIIGEIKYGSAALLPSAAPSPSVCGLCEGPMLMFLVVSSYSSLHISTDISFPQEFTNKTPQRELGSLSLTIATISHHLSPAALRRAGHASGMMEALRGTTPNLRGNRSRIDQWKMANGADTPLLHCALGSRDASAFWYLHNRSGRRNF